MTNRVGVFNSIEDRTFAVNGSGLISAGIVISAKKGSTDVKTITTAKQFIEEYGIPSMDNPSMYCALRYLNRAGFLSVLRVINDATVASVTANDGATTDEVTISAANAGAWGNNLVVDFVTLTNAPAGVFGVVVKESGEVVESFEVSLDPSAKNGFGRTLFIENVINSKSAKIRVTDLGTAVGGVYTATTVTLVGGADDTVAPTDAQLIAGWDKFSSRDVVEARFLINAGWTSAAVQQKMAAIAESRGNSVAILDVPEDVNNDVDGMVTYRNDELGLDTYFAGLYGGWLKIYDQYNDREVVIPVSGDVVANWVNTIEQGEFWNAAIGVENGNIPNALDTTLRMTEPERTLLYTNGINPVTKIGTANSVIFGQKSLQQFASGMDRINVVNNVLEMNVAMGIALLPYVGRDNTQLERDNANFTITSYLEGIKRRGGVYDYAVDTSDQINTADVIDNNQFFIDVYVKPTRTIEEIRTRLVVTATGVQLS